MPMFTTCPHCSILRNGSCFICTPGDENHPSCQDCEGGWHNPPRTPWYQSDLTLTLFTAVTVSVISAVIISQIQRHMRLDA
jgi:hypothetical protein